jgi:heptosyltransferase-3
LKINRIIISRTDAIGDVILTLPMVSMLKKVLPQVKIIFFGKTYTKPVIDCCKDVDEFLNYDEFSNLGDKSKVQFLRDVNADAIIHVFPRQDISGGAKHAHIRYRIGTTGRLHHWFNCNRLVRMTRKNSDLHEAQLNIKLLKPLGVDGNIPLKEISSLMNFSSTNDLPSWLQSKLDSSKYKLVIHPKSNASAREWSLENYSELIKSLPHVKFQFIITGGENEKNILDEWHKTLSQDVFNLAGKLSLNELIALLNASNGIVAASTGPLHIAAALGKDAIGIYPPIKPMDPGRWAPVGKHAEYLVMEKHCSDCRFSPQSCHCMNEVTAGMVADRVVEIEKKLSSPRPSPEQRA